MATVRCRMVQEFLSRPTHNPMKPAPKLASRLSLSKRPVNNWVVFSDPHCGSRLGLMDKDGFTPDQGGLVLPSPLQLVVWNWWQEMWNEWVPMATKHEPFGIIFNGDALEGQPHRSTSHISINESDQFKMAKRIFEPLVAMCDGRFKFIRGTEAHVGKSGSSEEVLAQSIGAIPNLEGQFSRFELWQKVGGGLVHLLHHIGTTGSSAYESTAVTSELTSEYVESARWGERRPDIIVRSHRHRCIEVRIPTNTGFATATVTPGWQLKTPFVYRIPGGRIAPPQFGCVLIRHGDRQLFTEPWVKHIKRDEPED